MSASIYFLNAGDLAAADIDAWLTGAGAHLEPDEMARMGAYVFPAKRLEFLLGRILLKAVLAAFHGVSAPRIVASEGEKPRLAGHPHGPFFNLSHSHGALAAIVAPDREVGIDLERLRPVSEGVVRRTLRAEELPAARTEEDFLRFWTVKEAYMKLKGAGLRIEPRALRVDLAAGLVTEVGTGETHPFRWERCGDFVLAWVAAAPRA